MKVINFFGAPGAGKSTTAAGFFYELKKRWVSAELVGEFAKELVWSDSGHLLSQQNYVFAHQEHRLNRLIGKVDVAVCDAPLLLSAFYAPENYPLSFNQSVFDFFNLYENVNILVRRSHEYAKDGRLQNEQEADAIALGLENFLKDNGIPFYAVKANNTNPVFLLYWLVSTGLIDLPAGVNPLSPDEKPPLGWIQPSLEKSMGTDGLPIPMAHAVAQRYIPSDIKTVGEKR